MLDSSRKLHRFEKYACKVYALPRLLASFTDTRRAPKIATLDVVNALFHGALMRRPSINAIEGDVKKADFQMVIGRKPKPDTKAFSAEVISGCAGQAGVGGPAPRSRGRHLESRAQQGIPRRFLRHTALRRSRRLGAIWCFGVVGKRARKSNLRTALLIVRARWHIENTGFCQWVKYWNLGRVYRHTPNAILAILLLWMLVFNLLQLFVYRRLKRPRKPADPCDTIISIVAEMCRDVGALAAPMPWEALADATSG